MHHFEEPQLLRKRHVLVYTWYQIKRLRCKKFYSATRISLGTILDSFVLEVWDKQYYYNNYIQTDATLVQLSWDKQFAFTNRHIIPNYVYMPIQLISEPVYLSLIHCLVYGSSFTANRTFLLK